MSIFSSSEFLKKLRKESTTNAILAIISHDVRNRSVSANSGIEYLEYRLKNLTDDPHIMETIATTKQQILDIRNIVDAIDQLTKEIDSE